jgi:hypothetical protein
MGFSGNASTVASHAALRLLSSSSNQTAFVAAANAAPDGGGGTYTYVASNTSFGSLFTGSVSGTTLTVAAVTNGALAIGLSVNRGDTGTSIGTIVALGTGTGGTGTYTLGASASIAGPLTFTADNDSSFIVAVDGARWFNVGYYPLTAAEVAASVTPTNYTYPTGDPRRYGVDVTGAVDCTTAINNALECYAQVRLPPGVYKIDGSANGGIIAVPANATLWALPGTATFNITANAGSTSVALSVFQLANHSVVAGLNVVYPNQTATNTVAAIIQYPPLFTINQANSANLGGYCHIRDITCAGAYIISSVQSAFYECFWERIVASALYRGLDFSGAAQMGDTSRAVDCEIVMTGSAGFDGGAVDQWCRTNAIGVNTNLAAGNRIDGFQLSNFNVIGGSLGYNIVANAWFQGSSISADICTQSIYNAGQFYITNLWASVQDNHVDFLNVPAIRNNGGALQVTGGRVGLQVANSQNALFIDSGSVDLVNVWFATSRGGFGPCIYNQYGAVNLSGCTVSSTGSTGGFTRALSWQDCVIGNLSTGNPQFSIDGKSNPTGVTGPMSGNMPGFDMSTWSGGIPTGWTSNLSPGQYATYFRDLFPIDNVHGVEVYGTTTGSFYLSYALPQLIDDLFGYYLVTFGLKIIGAGSAAASVFDITFTDNSGAAVYRLPVSWTGVNSETLGIPTGSYFAFVGLLCSPIGSAPGKVNFNFNFLTSTSQKYHIQTPVMFGMKPPPECSGAEYYSFQSCLPRDIQNGPTKYLRRVAAPTITVGWNDGDTAQRNPQAAGSPKGWVYVASTGSWASLGAL